MSFYSPRLRKLIRRYAWFEITFCVQVSALHLMSLIGLGRCTELVQFVKVPPPANIPGFSEQCGQMVEGDCFFDALEAADTTPAFTTTMKARHTSKVENYSDIELSRAVLRIVFFR
jgi:hypothetical protein